MRNSFPYLILAVAPVIFTGCETVIVERRPAYVEVAQPSVIVEAPVVEGPGVFVIDLEPPPVERVYYYEPGYPPGCYFYGGFYYWGGHRYEKNVFVNKVVNVNIQKNVYINKTENITKVERIKKEHVTEFEKTGGKRTPEARVAPERPTKPEPAPRKVPEAKTPPTKPPVKVPPPKPAPKDPKDKDKDKKPGEKPL